MVYWHFGRLEIIPPLLSGRLPYQYAIGRSLAAVYEIWSVDCQENHSNCCVQMRFLGAKYAKNAFAAGLI